MTDDTTTPRSLAIFGAADGLVASVGLVLATASHGSKVVLVALLGLLVAEGLGMAASEFLSDPKMSVRQALIMGVATSLPIVSVGLPWVFAGGSGALLTSGIIAVVFAAVIAQVRPGGARTWAETFGVLSVVAAIAAGAGRL